MGLNITNSDLLFENNPNLVKLGLIAAKIAHYNFETRFNTLVVFNFMAMIPMQLFFLNFYPVLVKKGKFLPDNRVFHVPQFVLFGQQSDELVDLLRWLIDVKYDNTAKFILTCISTYPEMCDENLLMRNLGDIFVSNVVFLKLSRENNGIPEAYTFYPLKPNKCWNSEPVKLNITIGCTDDMCFKSLFPEKYDNLYGCTFSITTYEQPPFMQFENDTDGKLKISGGDGDILNLLVNRLNATLIVKVPEESEWGHSIKNNWTGCLGDIFNHRTQAAICAIPLTAPKYGNFQISFTYASMDMVWAAPMSGLKPSWEKLLYPLPKYLRLITIGMFIVIVFMNNILKTKFWKNISEVLETKPTKSNLLIYCWIIFLGMPVVKLPRKFPFRILVFTWIWYCIIIRSLYQATLVGSLKLRIYENKLENFSEVLVRKWPFGGQPSLKEFFSEDRVIYNNWQHIEHDETEDMLNKISSGEMDFVIALNRETVINHLVKYRGTRSIQILPQKIVNSPTVIFFKHYSHMCMPVSKLLTLYVEGGFTQRLYDSYKEYVDNMLRRPNSHHAESIKLVHFTGLLILLMLGWLLAFVFFIIELACGKYRH